MQYNVRNISWGIYNQVQNFRLKMFKILISDVDAIDVSFTEMVKNKLISKKVKGCNGMFISTIM